MSLNKKRVSKNLVVNLKFRSKSAQVSQYEEKETRPN